MRRGKRPRLASDDSCSTSGILEKVEGAEEARAVAGVTQLEITARWRDYIAAWPEGSSYLGFLFARAKHQQS